MKIVLIDKAAKIVKEGETDLIEVPTATYYEGKCYIYRMARSNNVRWTYQEVSTLPCL